MGNVSITGFSSERLRELNADFSSYPPWVCVWLGLYMDMLCNPLQCRDSWRHYVPFGLAEKGQWFSEEFEVDGVMNIIPTPLSFEEFRAKQGHEVTPGSSLFAGVHSLNDLNYDWLQSLYTYLFRTPSAALSCLFSPTSLWTLCFLILLIRAFKARVMPKFESIGKHLAVRTHGEEWLSQNEERIVKFGEYVFRLCYHSFISIVAFFYFWDAPWWDESKGGTINLWAGFPNDDVAPGMCWYYLFQASYNVDAMISLLQISLQIKLFPKDSVLPITVQWAKTVRGDFNEMLAHHIVTNMLIFLSSYFRQTRIGSMVFWMHDLSDVPVDLAKLANFVKWKRATAVSFGLLCLMWALTRLYILPFTIWRAIYSESIEVLRVGVLPVRYFYAYEPLFLILLAILIVLHFLWFAMFIRMGYTLLTKGEAHDYSEHKMGEREHGGTSLANGNGFIADKKKIR